MKVLSIGMDRKLFEPESAVFSRSLEYAKKMEELHIVVFSTKGHHLKDTHLGNLHLYPTNSLSRLHYIFDAIKIGRIIIIKNKLDPKDSVLSTQDPFETGYVGYKLKKKFNLPLQVQIHTDFFAAHFKNSFLNIIRIFLAKIVLPNADGIRVVSEFLKDEILSKYPNIKAEIKVLPIFIDINNIINFQPKKDLSHDFPQFKFIILMASRLTSEKRIDIAIDSFKHVLLKFPHAGLVIAGQGTEKSYLVHLAKKLGISKHVAFIGWQSDLISLYKTADLFLVTSEYEGYGMTLIEAGASGCPIVTTKVGIASSGLFKDGKNSSVCRAVDVGCISKEVLDLISDNSKRELFKHAMQDSIKTIAISKEDYVKRYVESLNNLLND